MHRRTLGRTYGPPPEGPFALVERGPHGIVLVSLDAAARAAGLRSGQRHADARAMVPGLATAAADRAADLAALGRLAHWCLRWSPGVAVDACGTGLDGVFVEVAGSAHLFGGEAGLLADMRARCGAAGIAVRLGLADTPGAAWGAARFGNAAVTLVPEGGIRAAAAAWPLAALRLDPLTLARAARLGFRTVADLDGMPRGGLARRFRDGDGLGLVRRLDQLFGVEGEALDTVAPAARHAARAVFGEPVIDMAGVAAHLPGLLDRLAADLAAGGLGAGALALTGFRIDGGTTGLDVRLGKASRDTRVWARLLETRGLDRLDLGFGIDALLLAAPHVEPLAATQLDHGAAAAAGEPLNDLIDRLAARLGGEAIRVARPRARWLPERAEHWLTAQGAPPPAALLPGLTSEPATAPRPLLLLDPPEPVEATAMVPDGAPVQFRWRRIMRRVARAEGPERLAPEWWRETGRRVPRRTRDYYRVEADDGARYWLFREGLYGWEDAGRPPTWWLHGLFA